MECARSWLAWSEVKNQADRPRAWDLEKYRAQVAAGGEWRRRVYEPPRRTDRISLLGEDLGCILPRYGRLFGAHKPASVPTRCEDFRPIRGRAECLLEPRLSDCGRPLSTSDRGKRSLH